LLWALSLIMVLINLPMASLGGVRTAEATEASARNLVLPFNPNGLCWRDPVILSTTTPQPASPDNPAFQEISGHLNVPLAAVGGAVTGTFPVGGNPPNAASCRTFSVFLEPGTQAMITVTLNPTQSGGPLGGTLVIRCNWGSCGADTKLDDDGGTTTWMSPMAMNLTMTDTFLNNADFVVDGLGIGTYTVRVDYGALGATFAVGSRPAPIQILDNDKQAVTGDWDHTLYNDPSFLGLSPCIGAQNDADAAMDAGDTPNAAMVVPLGLMLPTPAQQESGAMPFTPGNRIRIGQRGLFVNNRVGTGASFCPALGGLVTGDEEDWYSFTVQPSTRVNINIWPTRYDGYGGGFHYQLFRLLAGGSMTIPRSAPGMTGDLLCGGDINPPYEPVFNPADCDSTAGASVGSNPTGYLLRVYGAEGGVVRYSMTVDYIGAFNNNLAFTAQAGGSGQ